MALTETFYRERAAEARAAAEATDLANVIERNMRSAAAWEAMADRAHRTDAARSAIEMRKAAAAALEQDPF